MAQSASVMGYITRCSISHHVTGLFAVLRTITMITAVSLDVKPRRLVQIHFFFSEEQSAFIFIVTFSYRANRGSTSFQNIGTCLQDYKVSPPGRQDVTFIVTDVRASDHTPVYLFVSPNIKVSNRTHCRTVLNADCTRPDTCLAL